MDNIESTATYQITYPNIYVIDRVNVHVKRRRNYTYRKGTVSKRLKPVYTVGEVGRGLSMNTCYKLEGLSRHFPRRELLFLN